MAVPCGPAGLADVVRSEPDQNQSRDRLLDIQGLFTEPPSRLWASSRTTPWMMQVTGAAFQIQVNPLLRATDPKSHTPVCDDTTLGEDSPSPTNPMIDPTAALPAAPWQGSPVIHNIGLFGARSRGLHPRSLQLHTPITGFARGVPYRLAG